MHESVIELGLVDDEEILLDHAALALAALDHEKIDLEPYEAILDEIEIHLAGFGADAFSAAGQAEILSRVLSKGFDFAGDRETYDDPDNADLIRVLDRRRGLPVSLSILYVSAARRVGWQAQALDVPGHVLVLIGDEAAPVIVDPFRGGAIVSPEDLAILVAQRGEAPAVRQIAAMPNRAILIRLLQNQASRAEAAGRAKRAMTLYERMTVFAPGYGHGWWERARLEIVDGRIEDARTSLAAMLEITREPELRARISATLGALTA